MATIVNTPQPAQPSNNDNGMGFFLGALILIIAAVMFFIYGLPYLQSAVSGPQINVPSDINVNLNKQN